MVEKKISVLGIPVSNLDLNECVKIISQEVEDKNTSQKYICTLNSDFIANIYGWGLQNVSNQELLNVIRGSTLVTPDGMPIVWLSKILGNGLKERVTGADLIPLLASELGKNNRSIFLLGGEREVAEEAAKKFITINPSLRIAGIATPAISIESDHDSLVDEINEAAPDVLFINLGNPKQEIWFNRVHKKLKVPVSIGIGGTLNFITGKTKRAPKWMQEAGLEWIYRIIQEPKRLFKRYFFDILKFTWLALPLIPYHYLNYLFSLPIDKTVENNSYEGKTGTLKLPKHFCSKNYSQVAKNLQEAADYEILVIDMTKTRHLDLEAISFLINTVQNRKHVHLVNIRWNVRILLILHKAWDILKPRYK